MRLDGFIRTSQYEPFWDCAATADDEEEDDDDIVVVPALLTAPRFLSKNTSIFAPVSLCP